MNKPAIFNHPQFGDLRIVDRDGKPWFIAKDVAKALGYIRTADAVREHCKGVGEMETPSSGGKQMMKIIPEADLFRLIMHSKLPDAEAFQDWVVEEVLPAIRKHGGYLTPAKTEEARRDPASVYELAEALLEERDRRTLLEERQEIFGNRTPYGEISERTGNPKTIPVRGHLKSHGKIRIVTTTEIQLRLFGWD